MDSSVKQSEMSVYDSEEDDRPDYDAYWADGHQDTLLSVGPKGHFQTLLRKHAPGANVLVLGCGSGHTVHQLLEENPNQVVGIDLAGRRLPTPASESEGIFARADVEQLPFQDDSFDLVVARAILHHLPNWDSDGLREIARVCTRGGKLVFQEPGKYNPPAAIRRHFFPSNLHTPDEHPFNLHHLEKALNRHFSDVSIEPHCLVSNALPVIFNQLPVSVPEKFTELGYRAEKPILRGPVSNAAWIFTGTATIR